MMRGLAPLLLATIVACAGPATAALQQVDAPPAPSTAKRGPGAFTARALPAAQRTPTAYDAISGNILFRLQVEGREVWGLIDSGAQSSMVDLTLARSAGLTVTETPQILQTTGGEMATWRADKVTIVVPGQIELNHTLLPAVDLSAISKAHNREVGFIAGQDWLNVMLLIVDPVQQLFQLGPSGRAPPLPGQVMALESALPPQIDVLIGGQRARVTIDTGYSGQLTLTPKAWARLTPADASVVTIASIGIDGNQREERATVLAEVSLGELTVTNVQVTESARWDDWAKGPSALATCPRRGSFWI